MLFLQVASSASFLRIAKGLRLLCDLHWSDRTRSPFSSEKPSVRPESPILLDHTSLSDTWSVMDIVLFAGKIEQWRLPGDQPVAVTH